MSLEAYGDEGNVPSRWEETAMRQELDKITAHFRSWWTTYKAEASNDVTWHAEQVKEHFDQMEIEMEGPL